MSVAIDPEQAAGAAYPRDMIGYGRHKPDPRWPGAARVAVQFVVNYEEGAENCVLHGDRASEAFLSEIVGAAPLQGVRHMNMESIYEYGSRAGFWRLHRLFTERGLPVTVFGVALALVRHYNPKTDEALIRAAYEFGRAKHHGKPRHSVEPYITHPEAVAAMQEADWEIASHGYRWIDYQYMPEEEERRHLQAAIALHREVTGARPTGWYLGRCSPNTQRLVIEEGGFLYDADSYADELPYWVAGSKGPHLIVPYTLDANDMRFATSQGFNSGGQFFAYLKDSLDLLYAEGAEAPKMLSVGLHCRLVGRPGRAAALARFLDYVQGHERVWVCRRADIAAHWRRHHPPAAG